MSKITLEEIEESIDHIDCFRYKDTTTTICCITLKNGYIQVSSSACTEDSDYNEVQGKIVSKKRGMEQLWALFGFMKKQIDYE